jgi:hypothetical protein
VIVDDNGNEIVLEDEEYGEEEMDDCVILSNDPIPKEIGHKKRAIDNIDFSHL